MNPTSLERVGVHDSGCVYLVGADSPDSSLPSEEMLDNSPRMLADDD